MIFGRLVERGLLPRRDRTTVRARWRFGAIFSGFVTFALGGVLGREVRVHAAAVHGGGRAHCADRRRSFGRLMPARTVAGARTLEQVLGFEEFLSAGGEGERTRGW